MGGAAAMSDERAKTEVRYDPETSRDFLGKLNSWSYEYKNPEAHGHGRFYSPMAQELEKSDVGKSAVLNTPQGKMVDYARLGGITLAAASDHEKRLRALESK
jgi:hypothetical protein